MLDKLRTKKQRRFLSRCECEVLESRWLLSVDYTVTDLGAGSAATGINALGQVVGFANVDDPKTSQQFRHSFIWFRGQSTDLGPPSGSDSTAFAINNSGEVVGTFDTPGFTDAFLYRNGTFSGLGTLDTFIAKQSQALTINSSGAIVGYTSITQGTAHYFRAFEYTGGKMQDLGTLGGHESTAYGINDSGDIVGGANVSDMLSDAFIYHDGVMNDLGNIGGTQCIAYAVNNSGDAAGWGNRSNSSGGGASAILFKNGSAMEIWPMGSALAINNRDQVVGTSSFYQNLGDRAYIYQYPQYNSDVDLNTLIDPGLGITLTSAVGINDAGQIAAVGYANGAHHSYLLTPLGSGNISGAVYNDANKNGAFDQGESGVSGATVFVDLNNDGTLDAGDPSATTDSNGAYTISDVSVGGYNVRVVPPTSWQVSSPASGGNLVSLAADTGTLDNVDFGMTEATPVAKPGGPYSVNEGASLKLDGSASSEIGGSIASYAWDFNYDGSNFTADAAGSKPTFSATGLDGPSTRTIALKVTDATGQSAISTTTVSINNVPPTAKFNSAGSVKLGSAGGVSFSAQSDPSPADVTAGFKYSYDFNNDGVFEIADSSSASATVPATYLASVGTHTIRGRIKDKDGGFTGYTATITVTAATTPASITGTIFADNNGNAILDAGELGVSGRKVYIDNNKNGMADVGEPTFTTGAIGAFMFTGLAAGTYRVRDVPPSGWRRTSPTTGYFDVTVSAGQTASGKNFAETTRGLISGTVFADNNGNAKLDSGELGVTGRKIYIDKNKNGVLDAGEPAFTTGANGAFTFNGLAAGTYRIRDVLPVGWRRTSPTSGYFDVTVSSGQVVTGKNFAETTRGLITGVVFKDANGSGVRDSAEVGLSGWVVFLDTNNNGKLDAGELNFTTGSDGKFSFIVRAGTYHLREVLKSGFQRTAPTGGVYTITLASGQTVTGKNFGDR